VRLRNPKGGGQVPISAVEPLGGWMEIMFGKEGRKISYFQKNFKNSYVTDYH
jgi:hypothetical protein